MAALQDGQKFLGTAGRMPLTKRDDRCFDVFGLTVRGSRRPAREFLQASGSVLEEPLDDLVAGLSADAVELTQLAHRPCVAKEVRNELRLLFPWRRPVRRHGAPPLVPFLLPMSPD